jgi:hypothetical protein
MLCVTHTLKYILHQSAVDLLCFHTQTTTIIIIHNKVWLIM